MNPTTIRPHALPGWGQPREPTPAGQPPEVEPSSALRPKPLPAPAGPMIIEAAPAPAKTSPRTASEKIAWALAAAWLYLRQNPGWMYSIGIHLAAGLVILGIRIGLVEQPPVLGLEARNESADLFGPFDQIGDSAPLTIARNELTENFVGLVGDLVAETSNEAQADQFMERSGASPANESGNDGSAEAGFNVAFFGAQAQGKKFVYVVDMSGSMTGERFRRAVTELTRSISKLNAEQSFYVFFFNDRTYPLLYPRAAKGLQKATKSNVARANRWINSRSPAGTTNPLYALEQALTLKPDAIFLLTDGELDNPAEAREILRKKNKSKITLHAIAFESEEGARTLETLAKENNGTFRFVK